jgi:hypothetical protein
MALKNFAILCNSTLIVFTDLFSVQHDAESVSKTEPGSSVAFDELGGNLCSGIYWALCVVSGGMW